MKNRLILLLLALLGLSTACDEERNEQEPAPEYGCPHIRFEVKGRVTDTTGNPIREIEVIAEGTSPTRTSATGAYRIEGTSFPFAVQIRFDDTDGPDNGGSFARKEVEVTFTEADRTEPGDDNWYDGAFGKTVDVQLEPDTEP